MLAGATAWLLLASRALLDGEHALAGLAAPVEVERDRLGVPTLRGRTRRDVARATGFVHAQERFFQMDLLRRSAAGELAALFGHAALELDRQRRLHGLRAVATAALAALSTDEREVLTAYVEGVNAGIGQLAARPPEYLLTRSAPAPWRPEDTLLVVHAMFLRLSDAGALYEMRRSLLFECLPDTVAAFLASWDSEWAAPVDGGALPRTATPARTDYDLRALAGVDFDTGRSFAESIAHDPDLPGGASNAWVVAGSRTADGRALVANDMHLQLRVPNVWYRARLIVEGGAEPALDANGVTLPGTPALIAGSNGHVAWGFTNSYGDWSDRIRIRLDPHDADRYITPHGPRPFGVREERIAVRGGDDVVHIVRETLWGPVVSDPLGRLEAIRWTGHDPDAVNLGLLAFEQARSVAEVLAIAPRVGMPPQNVNVGDRDGHIGWTIGGRIPRRALTEAGEVWNGWLSASAYPRVVDPPGGIIWTANHPVVTGEALDYIGDGGYWHGARAAQIRDALRALERPTEADMLAIQLDHRALLMARWRRLLLAVLDGSVAVDHDRATEFRTLIANGNDQAGADAVAYRLTWAFRARLRDVVFSAVTAPCRALVPGYRFEGFRQYEGPLWRLVSERPPHLLHPAFADWETLLATVAHDTIEYFATAFEGDFAERSWGEHNVFRMRHPLTRALPALGWLFDLEPTAMAGDRHMPLVMAADVGASERFAVAPGREATAYLHMPGGQSGHPLSPFYRAGHDAWLRGEPTPLLPGRVAHRLRLVPATANPGSDASD